MGDKGAGTWRCRRNLRRERHERFNPEPTVWNELWRPQAWRLVRSKVKMKMPTAGCEEQTATRRARGLVLLQPAEGAKISPGDGVIDGVWWW